MSNPSQRRRQICLGLGFGLGAGLACDLAMPRGLGAVPRPAGSDEEASGLMYHTVHHFSGDQGSQISSGLLLASDGNAYGTAGRGGLRDFGTIYRITPGKNVKMLHSFRPRVDGFYPVAPPIEAAGALYGVTSEGGPGSGGVAYRLAHDTGYTLLHEFGVTPGDARGGWGGLLWASDGYFYGASNFGGDNNRGLVYRMDLAGNVTPLWHLGAPGAPALSLAALIEGADGRLYGTTRGGGAHGKGTIYRLAKDGSEQEVLFSFSGADGNSPQVPLLETADGGLYGVTTFGGTHNVGTVFRFRPDGTHTVLHEFSGPDGREPNTELLMIEPGVFMGTTTFGGELGGGVAFLIHDDGSYQRVHRFGGTVNGVADGKEPSSNLVKGPAGQVIGTCRKGGANEQGTI